MRYAISTLFMTICFLSAFSTAGDEVILDTAGFWRMHHTLKSPVLQVDNALKPFPYFDEKPKGQLSYLKMFHIMVAGETAAPAADWNKPDFDDSGWVRAPARRECLTPYLSRLCLRGKFTVTDPAKVGALKLSLGYHGGVVVYVNGQELARQHVSKGAELAEAYPQEAYVAADGKLITLRGLQAQMQKDVPDETKKRITSRVRTLQVDIPGNLLQKGMNVVAIEIVRAPYHQVVADQMATSDNHGAHKVFEVGWNTCELQQVQLTAASGSGLVPNAVRPTGFQVWNSDPMSTDFDLDFGIQAEELRPIKLVGARNGVYSGKVVVGSDKPIQGLKAISGDLKGPTGSIPASQIRIRYATPWSSVALTHSKNWESLPYPASVEPLLAIAEVPLSEFPVRKKATDEKGTVSPWGWSKEPPLKLPGQPAPVFGAVVPVWVTVKVPKDAKPGVYTGTVTLEAGGKKLCDAPVEIKVLDWTLPDPRDFRTWVELIQSPDTLVLEYGMPMWSEKHWQMIEKSMSYIAEVGSSVIFVPLIAQSNAGNAESMVRWIKKGENQYEYDFSIMDKYLDLAGKHLGKLEVVVFNVWDLYLARKDSQGRGYWIDKGVKFSAKGPWVTFVDSAGKTENVSLPDYPESVSKGLWKPLFDQLRQRMAKRGLEKNMLLGMVSDFWATKEQVTALKEISGDLPWANAGHYIRKNLYDGLANFGYQSSYFGTAFGYTKSASGWKNPEFYALFERVEMDGYPMTKWRLIPEQSVTGNVRGVGRLGADAWPVVKDKNGKRSAQAWERWPGSDWGYLNCNTSSLAPSPEGPVATMRLESLREGVQESEALILLEEALLANKLGADAKRVQELLDERRAAMWRVLGVWQSGAEYSHELSSWRERPSVTGYTYYLGSGWQERSEKLFTLAGEVQKKLGGK